MTSLKSLPATPCGRGLPGCGTGPAESIYADSDPMCRTCIGGWTPHPDAVCPCCGSCCDCKCGPRRKTDRARLELTETYEAFQPCGDTEAEQCPNCRICRTCDSCYCKEPTR